MWLVLWRVDGSVRKFALLFMCAFLVSIAYFAFALPSVSFEPPTLDDSATTGFNWVFVNVTSSEPLNQSLLEWGNQSGYFNFSMLNSSPINWFWNFTNLSDGTYRYTVFTQNLTSWWNASVTRQVLAVPSAVIVRINVSWDANTRADDPSTNFGVSDSLIAGTINGSEAKTYLKFNLSQIPNWNYLANCNLNWKTVYSSGTGASNVYVYELDNISQEWDEGTIIWNNMPPNSSAPVSQMLNITPVGWYTFDVTNAARKAHYTYGLDSFSLIIMADVLTGTDDYSLSRSGEFGADQPYLSCLYTDGAIPVGNNHLNDFDAVNRLETEQCYACNNWSSNGEGWWHYSSFNNSEIKGVEYSLLIDGNVTLYVHIFTANGSHGMSARTPMNSTGYSLEQPFNFNKSGMFRLNGTYPFFESYFNGTTDNGLPVDGTIYFTLTDEHWYRTNSFYYVSFANVRANLTINGTEYDIDNGFSSYEHAWNQINQYHGSLTGTGEYYAVYPVNGYSKGITVYYRTDNSGGVKLKDGADNINGYEWFNGTYTALERIVNGTFEIVTKFSYVSTESSTGASLNYTSGIINQYGVTTLDGLPGPVRSINNISGYYTYPNGTVILLAGMGIGYMGSYNNAVPNPDWRWVNCTYGCQQASNLSSSAALGTVNFSVNWTAFNASYDISAAWFAITYPNGTALTGLEANLSSGDRQSGVWSYLLTNAPGGTYTVLSYSNDSRKVWVRSSSALLTGDIVLPSITIMSPLNVTYPQNWVWANVTSDMPVSWCGVSLNGAANQTMSNASQTDWYLNLAVPSEGLNNVTFYCNSTSGGMGNSSTAYFTIDTIAPNITSWSTNGTNASSSSDIMFLVGTGELVLFNMSVLDASTLTYQWLVNKVDQNQNANNFTFAVPSCDHANDLSSCIWEVHLVVNDSTGLEAHKEWVVSNLSVSEAPDLFESFTDGILNGTREVDPWGRLIKGWTVYNHLLNNLSAQTMFLKNTGVNGSQYSRIMMPYNDTGRSWTILFRFKATTGYGGNAEPGVTVGLSASDSISSLRPYLDFTKATDTHNYVEVDDDDQFIDPTNICSSHAIDVFHPYNYGANPGIPDFTSYNSSWHEGRFIYDENRDVHLFIDGHRLPAGQQRMANLTGGAIIQGLKNIFFGIRQRGTTGDSFVIDGVEIYGTRYLFPKANISYGSYAENYMWVSTAYVPTKYNYGILVNGRNTNNSFITLAQINASINNASLFYYDPSTRTADTNISLVLGPTAYLRLDNQTLRFHPYADGNMTELRMRAGSSLEVMASNISGIGLPVKFVTTSEIVSADGEPWENDSRLPNGWLSTDNTPFTSKINLIVENSTLDNMGFLFIPDPNKVVLKNSILNLAMINISSVGGIVQTAVTNNMVPYVGRAHGLSFRLDAPVGRFDMSNISLSGSNGSVTLLFVSGDHIGGTFLKDSLLAGTSVVLRKDRDYAYGIDGLMGMGAQTCGVNSSLPEYVFKENPASVSFVNVNLSNASVSLETNRTLFFRKYYLDVLAKDVAGVPMQNITVSVLNEQNDTGYPAQNMYEGSKWTTWQNEGFFKYNPMSAFKLLRQLPMRNATTDSSGHSPPPSNADATLVLTDYKIENGYAYNSTTFGQTNFTYTITAQGNDFDNSSLYFNVTNNISTTGLIIHPEGLQYGQITGVNPNETWYRPNPEIPVVTVNITLGQNRTKSSIKIRPMNASIIATQVTDYSIRLSSSTSNNEVWVNNTIPAFANKTVYLLKNNSYYAQVQADSQGFVSFYYTGGFSSVDLNFTDGGNVSVYVSDGSSPVSNASVSLRYANGTELSALNTTFGWANFTNVVPDTSLYVVVSKTAAGYVSNQSAVFSITSRELAVKNVSLSKFTAWAVGLGGDSWDVAYRQNVTLNATQNQVSLNRLTSTENRAVGSGLWVHANSTLKNGNAVLSRFSNAGNFGIYNYYTYNKSDYRIVAAKNGTVTSVWAYLVNIGSPPQYTIDVQYDNTTGYPNGTVLNSTVIPASSNNWVQSNITFTVTAGQTYHFIIYNTTDATGSNHKRTYFNNYNSNEDYLYWTGSTWTLVTSATPIYVLQFSDNTTQAVPINNEENYATNATFGNFITFESPVTISELSFMGRRTIAVGSLYFDVAYGNGTLISSTYVGTDLAFTGWLYKNITPVQLSAGTYQIGFKQSDMSSDSYRLNYYEYPNYAASYDSNNTYYFRAGGSYNYRDALFKINENLTSGSLTTPIQDAKESLFWRYDSFNGSVPANTSVDIYASASDDNASWAGFLLVRQNATPNVLYERPSGLQKRYAQSRYVLLTNDSVSTPEIYSVTLSSESLGNAVAGNITYNQIPKDAGEGRLWKYFRVNYDDAGANTTLNIYLNSTDNLSTYNASVLSDVSSGTLYTLGAGAQTRYLASWTVGLQTSNENQTDSISNVTFYTDDYSTWQSQSFDNDPLTFWVRTDGNDTCSGQNNMSFADNATVCAWRTINKSTTTITAGQTVRVQAGVYTEGNDIANSGTVGNYTIFLGDGWPLINISDELNRTCFKISQKSYIKIVGFNFTKTDTDLSAASKNRICIQIDRGNHITLESNIIANNIYSNQQTADTCIYVGGMNVGSSNNTELLNNTIVCNGYGISYEENLGGAHNATIAYNHVRGGVSHWNNDSLGETYGGLIVGGYNFNISYNYVDLTGRDGMDIGGCDNCDVYGNELTDRLSHNMVDVNPVNTRIYNNYLHDLNCTYAHEDNGFYGPGLTSTHNNTFYNNRIENICGRAFATDSVHWDFIVENLTIKRQNGVCVQLLGGTTGYAFKIRSQDNITFRNILCEFNSSTAYAPFDMEGVTGANLTGDIDDWGNMAEAFVSFIDINITRGSGSGGQSAWRLEYGKSRASFYVVNTNDRTVSLVSTPENATIYFLDYLDVLVRDATGANLSGVIVSFTPNTSDPKIVPKNLEYARDNKRIKDISSTGTGFDGHTPLPSNRTRTVAVVSKKVNVSGTYTYGWNLSAYDPTTIWTNITHTIYPNGTIQQLQPLAQVTGVNPDSSWYRPDPNTYQNTTLLQINYTRTNITVNANQNETNITVTRWNTSLLQGQILVNFTAESITGNNVNFTVCSLTASASYDVKNDGSPFATKTADSFGCIWFNNSVWTSHVFTVAEETPLIEYIFGNLVIANATDWTNRHIVLTGNISIVTGGVLNLLDGTILEMNVSSDLQYEIKLNGSGKLIVNDSTITSFTKNWSYDNTKNSRIHLTSGTPTIQANNATFSFLGSVHAAFRQDGAITIEASGTDSYVRNSVFQYVISAASVLSGTHLDVTGTRFLNLGSDIPLGQAHAIYGFYYYYPSTQTTYFTDNYFDTIVGYTDAQPTNIDTMSNIVYDNVTIYNLSSNAVHHINFYGNIKNMTMNNIHQDGGKGITFNNPLNTWLSTNISMENITWSNSIGSVFTWTKMYSEFTARKISATGGGLFLTTCVGSDYCLWNSNISDVVWTGNGDQGGLIRMVMRDSRWSNFDINGTAGNSMFWFQDIQSASYPTIQSKNNILENFTFDGTHGANGGYDAAVVVSYASNNSFIDWAILMDDGYDLYVAANTTNNRWINIFENAVGVVLGSRYEKYSYLDVLVKDAQGDPLSGARVSATNMNDSSYPSINRNGDATSFFTTTTNGHTPLPLGKDTTTAVIMDYLLNASEIKNMTHTISAFDPSNVWTSITHTIYPNGTIQQLQPLAQVTNVTPDASWYRPDPNVPTHTVNLTINYTKTNLSVNANQNETNITVTRWNTSLPQGQVLVNFTAESVNGNNVNFTVCSLAALTNYAIKNDGSAFATKTANTQGCVWFNNSAWTSHMFTVEEQSQDSYEEIFGDQVINSTVEWNNRHIRLTGNLNITHNGTLIIYNTTLEMNVSYNYQYLVIVDANGKLVINNSNVTSKDKYWNANATNNSAIWLMPKTIYINEHPTLQIENSIISYMGADYAPDFRKGYAIVLYRSAVGSYIRNSVISYSRNGIEIGYPEIGYLGAHIDITGTTFNHIGNGLGSGTAVYYYYPNNETQNVFTNIVIDDLIGGNPDTQPVYIDHLNSWYVDNITATNVWAGEHTWNTYFGLTNSIVKNVYYGGNQSFLFSRNSNNVTLKNTLGYGSGGITFNSKNINLIIDNIRVIKESTDSLYGAGIYSQGPALTEDTESKFCYIEFCNVAYPLEHAIITNLSLTNLFNGRAGPTVFYTGAVHNVTLKNVNINISTGYLDRPIVKIGRDTISNQNWTPPGTQATDKWFNENVWENWTIIGKSSGITLDDLVFDASLFIQVKAVNNIFRDINIIRYRDATYKGNDIALYVNVSGNYWINVHDEDNVTVKHDSSSYEKYAYLDVLAEDRDGASLPNITLSIANDINLSYPSINRNGHNKTTFRTSSDGHTYKPLSSNEETAVVMDYLLTNATQQDMAHTISAYDSFRIWTNIPHTIYPNGTIQQLQPLAQVTGVNPDSSWYRPDPNTYQNTTVLQINYTKTNLTVNANQNATNITVTRWNTSLPQGQILVNFTAESVTGNNVNFTVCSLAALTNYTIKNDGYAFATKTADSSGCIWFNNSVWTSHTFTVEEQSQGPSGCSAINAASYNATTNTITLNNQTSTLCTLFYDVANSSLFNYSSSTDTYFLRVNLTIAQGAGLSLFNQVLKFDEPSNNSFGVLNYGLLNVSNSVLTSVTGNAWYIDHLGVAGYVYLADTDVSLCGNGVVPCIQFTVRPPNNLTWRNVTFHDSLGYEVLKLPGPLGGPTVEILNSTFYNLYWRMIEGSGIIRGSKFHNLSTLSGGYVILTWGDGGSVYDSEFYDINIGAPADGSIFYCKEGSGGCTFQNNHIYNVNVYYPLGFYASFATEPIIFRNNLLENSTVLEAVYWRANQYFGGVNLTSEFYNNVLRNINGLGLSFHSGGQNVRIWNNTLTNVSGLDFRADYQASQAGGGTYNPGDSEGSILFDMVLDDIRIQDLNSWADQTIQGRLLPFANVNYTTLTVDMPDDWFYDYKYFDVLVTYLNGTPISGATVNISNEVDVAYPSINLYGRNQTSFSTGLDGYTGLSSTPLNRPTIIDYRKNSSSYLNYTHGVLVYKKCHTQNSSSNIDPNASWYNPDPYTHKNTLSLAIGWTNDTQPASPVLSAPANNRVDNDGNIIFRYTVTDTGSDCDISGCSLIVNGQINQTDTGILVGAPQTFELQNLAEGNYSWSINCTDASINSNEGASETWAFVVNHSRGSSFFVVGIGGANWSGNTQPFQVRVGQDNQTELAYRNYVVNPGFEDGISGWAGWDGSTTFVTSEGPYGGNYSLKMNNSAVQHYIETAPEYWVPVSEGQVWLLSFWARTENTGTAFIYLYDQDGNWALTNPGTSSGVWAYTQVNHTVAAGDSQLRVRPYHRWLDSVDDAAFWDNISFMRYLPNSTNFSRYPNGTLSSLSKDAESIGWAGSEWDSISFEGSLLNGSNVSIYADSPVCGGFVGVKKNARPLVFYDLPSCAQTANASWKLVFETNDSTLTPEVYNITLRLVSGSRAPLVTLNTPFNASYLNTTGVAFNCSASSSNSLAGLTIYGNWSGWHANETRPVGGNSNSTIFTRTLYDGSYIWNCLAFDSIGNSSFALGNYSFTIDTVPPGVTVLAPSYVVSHTPSVFVGLNSSEALSSAWLEWNGTSNLSMAGSGTVWYYNKSVSQSGNYSFRVFANDSAGNWNVSGLGWVLVTRSKYLLNLSVLDRFGNVTHNASIRVFNSSQDLYSVRLNGSTTSLEAELDSGVLNIEYLLPFGASVTLSDLSVNANLSIFPQFVDVYSGTLPDSALQRSYVVVLNDSPLGYSSANIVLPVSGGVNRILHCTDWNFSSVSCSAWESNTTSDYAAAVNSTLVAFNVSGFDAYVAAFVESPAPPTQGGGPTGSPAAIVPASGSRVLSASFEGVLVKLAINFNRELANPAIKVNQLSIAPVPAPAYLAYQYFNFTKINFNNSDIANASIEFKVNKSWINEKNIMQVYLARYSNSWIKLRTELVNSTGTYNNYRASVTGFSYFAILGETSFYSQIEVPIVVNKTPIVLVQNQSTPTLVLVTQQDIDEVLAYLNSVVPQTQKAKQILDEARLKLADAQEALNNEEQDKAKSLLERARKLVGDAAILKSISIAPEKSNLFSILLLLTAIMLAGVAYQLRIPDERQI